MKSRNNPVSIELTEEQVNPGDIIHGTIMLSYNSRYDSVVINSQLEGSSGDIKYVELNGRQIDYPYPRLSIIEKDISGQKQITFIAKIQHVSQEISTRVKFRVSIIQEHKEIASDVSYLTLGKQ